MEKVIIAALASILMLSNAQAKTLDSCRLDLEAMRLGLISYIVLDLGNFAVGDVFVRLPLEDLPMNSDVHIQIDNNAPWRMSDFSEPSFFIGDRSGKRGYSVGVTGALIRKLLTEMASGVRLIVFDANRRGAAWIQV